MKSTSSKATVKMAKPCKVMKDGHGPHWHSVGWIAAIAIVLSASTMTLAASASTDAVSQGQSQLDRIEAKIDAIQAKLEAPAVK